MLGNVWEWTSSKFAPYPDFLRTHTRITLRPGLNPLRDARRILGDLSRLVHHRFRNFYQPERHDPLLAFVPAHSRLELVAV